MELRGMIWFTLTGYDLVNWPVVKHFIENRQTSINWCQHIFLYNCGKQHCVCLSICFPTYLCTVTAKAEKQWENITANWKWLHIESSIERVFSGNSLGPDRGKMSGGGSSCTTISTHTIEPLSEIGESFFCRSFICSFERVLRLFALMMDRMREKFVLWCLKGIV